jgi:hypothetical protein
MERKILMCCFGGLFFAVIFIYFLCSVFFDQIVAGQASFETVNAPHSNPATLRGIVVHWQKHERESSSIGGKTTETAGWSSRFPPTTRPSGAHERKGNATKKTGKSKIIIKLIVKIWVNIIVQQVSWTGCAYQRQGHRCARIVGSFESLWYKAVAVYRTDLHVSLGNFGVFLAGTTAHC